MKKFLLFVTLAFSFLFLTCSADKNLSSRYQIEKAFQLGEQFRQNVYINLKAATAEDYDKAIAYYQEVKNMSPFPKTLSENDSLAQDQKEILNYTQLASARISELLLVQKKYDQTLAETRTYLAQFKKNDSNRQMLHFRMAQIYELKELPDSALIQYRQVLDEYAQNPDRQNPVADLVRLPFYLIGMHLKKGDFAPQHVSEAAEFYKKLISSPPDDPLSGMATQSLAELYLRDNKFEQAVATMEAMVDTSGKIYPQAMMAMGDLYLDVKGDFPLARKAFNRFLELYPNHPLVPFARYGIGRTFFEEKQYQKALEVFNQVKALYALDPRAVPATQFQIGLSYHRMNNWERAKSELDWLVLNYPDSPEGMKAAYLIADYYRQQKNPDQAKAYFDKAIQQYKDIIAKNPNTPPAYSAAQLLTEVYLTNQRWAEAAGQLEDYLKAIPEGSHKADIYLMLGELYETKLQDKEKANQTYAQFLIKYPQDLRAKEALDRASRLSREMQGQVEIPLPGDSE